MDSATWYLGPAGGLRPLVCPEPNISMNLVRYGGVFQALSGARTMDVTGHKFEYGFQWKYMDAAEWSWLDALHTRFVPGPLWLINPMRNNLMSRQGSMNRVTEDAGRTGVQASGSASLSMSDDWPSQVPLPGRSLQYFRTTVGSIYFDRYQHSPVNAGETVWASLWTKTLIAGTGTTELCLSWFDRTDTQIGSTVKSTITASGSWAQKSFSAVAPSGAAYVGMHVEPATNTTYLVAAPSLSMGGSQPEFEIGGAASQVVVDQLSTSSQRFPLTDCSLSLLEV